mmetsp:Transcript_40598/g.66716  ORF Transcript_40598/g.66716 Transcript_40598/m.66716 type:complete len:620 (+) Transcript_40598:113-1972(+)|eukprot:CAMPEP_0202697508 /NCGR_PEP_ID=MMETSP1385-20130828/10840_1 /ASSEMBLY_ACC=CAM_ASM_000861 /TAXON_ID=933848 /ORGANISM="Elphidium margaritaceum" /LENGTH=619 /DNA_ID=CAMNT_0049353991 /DNA_START=104 /DNA_END=1963 /DNA_ORIENTATION=+
MGKKGQNVKIFARVRNLMPWEPRKTSLQVVPGNKLRNKTEKHTNEYGFNKVFGIDITNEQIYTDMTLPMIDNVLKGFNAVLIAYGQTGSGKTFTMLGKPKLGVVGVLPQALKEFVDTPTVYKLELAAVEAFGHHVAKIELYDLYLPHNQVPNWNDKKGDTGQEMAKAIRKEVPDLDAAYALIRYAHAASHFAPTGKNPESSRGHVTFVAKVYQEMGDSNEIISFFLFLDCAGSEGESAFTKEFAESVDKETLLARRLEAGCINTGLSSLQIIFNELSVRGKLSNMLGNGLRRVLHPFINNRTIIAVLFTFSPSVNNAKPTESTLKFAVTAGMVKVQPVKAEISLNVGKLVEKLRKVVADNEKLIEQQQDSMFEKQTELDQCKQELALSGGNYESVKMQDAQDMRAMGFEGTEFQASSNANLKGKDVSHLQKSVLDKLAYLDDDEDDGWDMDDDFLMAGGGDMEKDLEQQLNAAYNAAKKGQGAAKLLKEAVGVEYEEDEKGDEMNMDDLEAAMDDTLHMGHMDIDDVTAQNEAVSEMMKDQVELNFDEMPMEEVAQKVTTIWSDIQENRSEQDGIKEQQKQVVGHLVETNEWLFAKLQETLGTNEPSVSSTLVNQALKK